MAKRLLSDLDERQRKALREFAYQLGVSEVQMLNMLNSLADVKPRSPWDNLDTIAHGVQRND